MTPKHIRIGLGVLVCIVAIVIFFTGKKVVASYVSPSTVNPAAATAPNGNAGYDTNQPGTTNGQVSGTFGTPNGPVNGTTSGTTMPPPAQQPQQRPASPQNTPMPYSDGTY